MSIKIKSRQFLLSRLIIFISLSGIFILFTGHAYSMIDGEALKFYQEGSYRHSASILKAKWIKNALEYYLMGRDYQELKEQDNAAAAFNQVNINDLKRDVYSDFYCENYAYYYSSLLYQCYLKSPLNSSTNNLKIIPTLFHLLKDNSIYYEDVLKTYLLYEWKNKDFVVITNMTLSNTTSAMYKAFSFFALGNKSFFPVLINFNGERDFHILFNDITNLIEQSDLDALGTPQIPPAYSSFNKINNAEIKLYLLNRYAKLSNEDDFFVRNKTILAYKEGDAQKAFEIFNAFLKHGKCSINTIQYFLNTLYQNGHYEKAYQILKLIYNKYSNIFQDDWIKVLTKLNKFDELYNWYAKKKALDPDYEKYIYRFFLQSKSKYAPAMLSKALKKDDPDGYFLTISALFDLNENKLKSAYSKFLRVSLYKPFTYEWIISKEYEKSMRTNFISLYEQEMNGFISNISRFSLKDKLNSLIALRDIDPGKYKEWNDLLNVTNLLAEFQTGITNTLSINSSVPSLPPEWLSLSNSYIMAHNLEILNYLEKICNNPLTRYKASYQYQDFYRVLKLDGLVVARLNNYITKLSGGREYHPLLDDKLRKTLYPDNLFNNIFSLVSNTNDSFWILSAFREESHFNKNALSSAGAVGLTQLMPATAAVLKKNMKKEDYNYYDFQDNLEIGITHLAYLLKKYHHNYLFSLAAYNAGETMVNRWKRKYPYENELWVEFIEYDETREYVKKIIQTRYFYENIYGKTD